MAFIPGYRRTGTGIRHSLEPRPCASSLPRLARRSRYATGSGVIALPKSHGPTFDILKYGPDAGPAAALLARLVVLLWISVSAATRPRPRLGARRRRSPACARAPRRICMCGSRLDRSRRRERKHDRRAYLRAARAGAPGGARRHRIIAYIAAGCPIHDGIIVIGRVTSQSIMDGPSRETAPLQPPYNPGLSAKLPSSTYTRYSIGAK